MVLAKMKVWKMTFPLHFGLFFRFHVTPRSFNKKALKNDACKTTFLLAFGHFSGVMLNWVVVSNIFYFPVLPGEDEPILTSIFFRWVGKNHQPVNFRRVKNSVEYILLFLPSSSGERRSSSDLGRL